ncbi:MAG: murein biosynthesis integral membrane protein MurJ [Syntrophomonadaceae bacterium]|nr:murein biosynthesis integral membrane protein MurJ [Syntrophomonadaceae bacterium]
MLGTIARATIILFLLNFLSKTLGLVREIVIAQQFGASAEVDAYLVAFTLPSVLFALIAGALTTVVIPVYSEYAARDGEAEAWRLFSTVGNVLLLLLTALMGIGLLLAPWLVKILAPGFTGETERLTVELTRIMFPLLIFSGLSALFNGLLNARNIFGVTALNAPLSNLGVIIAVLTTGHLWGVRGMALGLLIGGMAGALVQIPALYKSGFRWRWELNLRHPGLKKILKLIMPIAVGLSISQTYILVDRILASGLVEGSIAALNYANRLIQMPLGLFVTAVGTAFFPAFTHRAAEGNWESLRDGIRRGLRIVILVCLPAAVGLMLLREPLIALFFQRGAFDARAVDMTSIALFFYSLGLVGQAGEFILVRGFFSLHDTRTPVKLGIIVVLINLAFSLLLIRPLQHGGLALANSLAALTSLALLSYYLNKRLPGLWRGGMGKFTLQIILASGVMGIVVYLINQFGTGLITLTGTLGAATQVGLAVGAGLGIYLIMLLVLRLEETQMIWALARRRRETGSPNR